MCFLVARPLRLLALVLTGLLLLGGCDTGTRQASVVGPSTNSQLRQAGTAAFPYVYNGQAAASSRTAAPASAAATYSLKSFAYIPAPWYGTGSPPDAPTFDSVQIGDVTGDGRNDIVALGGEITLNTSYELMTYAQQANGSFALAGRYPLSLDSNLYTVMGDFNEDGIKDVVVTGSSQFTMFTSAPGNGFAQHTQAIYDPIGLDSEVPAVTKDIDGDGHLDLVFYLVRGYGVAYTTATFPRLVVWFGDGLGGFARRFSAQTYGTNPYDTEAPISIASGDLNDDGKPDYAVRVKQFDYAAQSGGQLIRVFLNDGHGGLVPSSNINATMDVGSTYSSMDYLAIGDFNHDGLDDVAGSPGSNDMRTWVLLQSPAHRFDLPPMVRSSEPIGTALVTADLDNDGAQDLLIAHDGWGRVTYYLQHAGVLTDKVMEDIFGYSRIQQTGLAVGDINGDGCPDAVVAVHYDGLTLMRGSNCSTAPLHPLDDFNGDYVSDILWRNHTTGGNVMWQSAKSETPRTVTTVADQAWQVAGVSDFNGDSKADIFWRNASTGANVIWRSGLSATPQSVASVGDLNWQIVGVGDFTADGKADILWRNSVTGANVIWKSASSATQQAITGVADRAWKVAGVGDLNGDGKADILWRNSVTGANVIWKSASSATQQTLTGVADVAWQVVGVADFNGDGKADILWRNGSTGADVIWKSGLASSQLAVTGVTNLDWHVVATGDYSGDGVADILWRNMRTGANVIWTSARSTTLQPVTSVVNLACVVTG